MIDLTGKRFGRWTVLRRAGTYGDYCGDGYAMPTWLCRCDCGNVRIVTGNSLRMGRTVSCGCYRKEAVSRAQKQRHANERKEKLIYG